MLNLKNSKLYSKSCNSRLQKGYFFSFSNCWEVLKQLLEDREIYRYAIRCAVSLKILITYHAVSPKILLTGY